MSETVNECLLVMEIPELREKDRNQAYAFFREKLGEPAEVEEWDGRIEYFEYEGDLKPVEGEGKWGIAYVISKREPDYGTESAIVCLDDLLTVAKERFHSFLDHSDYTKCVHPSRLILANLHWYSGVEAPDIFKEVQKI
tara:strand:+ start:61252 stop:61668 length:417 start_codon:yes stop_codon:yes gene_type:complete